MVSEQRFIEWWGVHSDKYTQNNVTKEVAYQIWKDAIYYNVSDRDKLISSVKDRLCNSTFKPKYRKYG
jgi:hypothetical protein